MIAICSFAIGAVGLVEILSGVADAGAYGAMVFLLGTGTFATIGARRAFKAAPEPKALPAGDAVGTVLALAAREGGRLTITEIAAKTPLSLSQAHAAMEELRQQNMLQSIITDDGVELFQIKGLLGPAEKAAARDILD
ncbi:MAG: hypothetical protein H6713_41365 [Myxococcales bacterium]|nr:hypothetical protein [Myxococcales bacterium]